MTYIQEWQLKAHIPELAKSTALVALSIAARIPKKTNRVRLSQRTLIKESYVNTFGTIKKSLDELEGLGVIRLEPAPRGSRKATLIIWALECPQDCQVDHNNGNAKTDKTLLERQLETLNSEEEEKATRSSDQSETRSSDQSTLISINKRERSSLISSIEKALSQIEQKTSEHQALIKALANSEEVALVQVRAEQIALKPHIDNPANYLGHITRNEPWKLLPKPKPKQAPPDYSHLRPELREVLERKYKAQTEAAVNEH